MTFEIQLQAGDIVTENRIVQERDKTTATYTLPRGARRVVVYDNGGGRGQLMIGGFTSITVSVKGDMAILNRLREAVL